jgi:hypothetical protein
MSKIYRKKNKKLLINKFILDEIESIECVGEIQTIDISVDETEMFYANDIYTHNSSVNEDKFDLKVISESFGKAQTADVIIGIARTDQHKQQSQARMMILKNRNGEEGIDIDMHFDTRKINIYAINTKFDSAVGIKGLDVERRILNDKNYTTTDPPF